MSDFNEYDNDTGGGDSKSNAEYENNGSYAEKIDAEQLLQNAQSPKQDYGSTHSTFNRTSSGYSDGIYNNDNGKNEMPAQKTNLSTASIICAVLGFICCGFPLSLAAIILYFIDKNNNPNPPKAGLILGIIGLVLSFVRTALSFALYFIDIFGTLYF